VELTSGQKAADAVATFMGSWKFVISQAVVMVLWFALNATAWAFAWDPYPFILLNLAMSAEAAFATPLLLMSQNRAAELDRQILNKDYLADTETNLIVEKIAEHLGIDWRSNDG
jgi:uncharacterized membrane protein